MEDDPEQQFVYRRIFRPAALRPGDEVGSSRATSWSCRFSIGDIIRPAYCLADLRAYRCGAICQVVELDYEGDPIVSYFEPSGELSEDTSVQYTEHFEKVCTAEFFAEYPQIPHSIWESVLNTNY